MFAPAGKKLISMRAMVNKVIPNYLGSKAASGLYQFILNNVPSHHIYIEGFLGGGTILQTKTLSARNIAFEVDQSVYSTWAHRQTEFNLEIHNKSFIEHWPLIAKKLPLPLCFVYLDPPYLQTTRSSSHRYKHEMTIDDHKRLLELVHTVKTNYMISCYDNALYTEILSDWRKESTTAMTRGGVRLETIYMNYPADPTGETLYAGSNFTDRQRIKRKVGRMVKKIMSMSALDRACVLHAINTQFFKSSS